jgi:serine/threonine-protein kinase RsbW
MQNNIIFHIESQAKNVMLLVAAMRGTFSFLNFLKEDIESLILATVEVVNNAIQHAYLNQPGKEIKISLTFNDKYTIVEIVNYGLCIEKEPSYDLPASESEGGRGWFIIKSCVDQVSFRSKDGINNITLVKSINLGES